MPELSEALAELARTDTLLVALDFDGTLAPLVDDPADARALPEAREAILALLAIPRTRVALISGRAMASLIEVSEAPDGILLSGSHGVEVRLDSEPLLTLTAEETGRVAELGEALHAVAERFDGVWVETKPAGFALHTRLASAEAAQAAVRDAQDAVAAMGGLTTRRGSNVLEFSVRSTNKGDAVERLREHSGATAVFFAGDDVTDEDAFAALGPQDLGLKCGSGPTRAAFSVPGLPEVAQVLHELATARAHS
ncbi:MAG TPA: trehalose-phosphatase [Homoserinimonas sp.]|nr:trehalose-phosphatase [Homoserinimonas sp.]